MHDHLVRSARNPGCKQRRLTAALVERIAWRLFCPRCEDGVLVRDRPNEPSRRVRLVAVRAQCEGLRGSHRFATFAKRTFIHGALVRTCELEALRTGCALRRD